MVPLLVLSLALLFPIEATSQPSDGGGTTMAEAEEGKNAMDGSLESFRFKSQRFSSRLLFSP